MSKFKIGDKVKVKKKYRKEHPSTIWFLNISFIDIPKYGEIIAEGTASYYLVEFDDWDQGHDGIGHQTKQIRTPKPDSCRFFSSHELKKI